MSDNVLFPIGKYAGKPLQDVISSDPQTINWYMGKDWFKEKHPKIYNLIINNFSGENDDTPEHNKLVARLLDSKFVNSILRKDEEWTTKLSETLRSTSTYEVNSPRYKDIPYQDNWGRGNPKCWSEVVEYFSTNRYTGKTEINGKCEFELNSGWDVALNVSHHMEIQAIANADDISCILELNIQVYNESFKAWLQTRETKKLMWVEAFDMAYKDWIESPEYKKWRNSAHYIQMNPELEPAQRPHGRGRF